MRRHISKTVLVLVVGLLVVVSTLSVPIALAEPNVSEEAYVEEVPKEGDPYFEAVASDGSWISYDNPRDEYRGPYLGEGSAKMCVALYNENGEPIVGESVPNTTVTIPTGEMLDWHSSADPITVKLPMTEHYDRPLDADQFGTSDLPQGDGYLDSHCYEFHGLPEDATVEYGEVSIEGEHADRIDLVGYIQQEHEAWDSDTDPIADAESYDKAGGEWTYRSDGSHGQVVVVLQLNSSEDSSDDSNDDDRNDRKQRDDESDQDTDEGIDDASETADGTDENETTDTTDEKTDQTDETTNKTTKEIKEADEDAIEGEDNDDRQSGPDQETDEMPGFGIPAALVALLIIALARTSR